MIILVSPRAVLLETEHPPIKIKTQREPVFTIIPTCAGIINVKAI